MTLKAFETSGKPASKLAATTTSGATYGALDKDSTTALITNAGPNSARIRFSGPSLQAPATAVDVLVLPNTSKVFSKGNATAWAAICDAGTAAIEATDGEGF